ncbi:hypothetical protein L2E82_38569 [Cichorium intybus]|uniref:Uncharacterized protein n=1 Tax=Cichorium intybus TaxID=13427 RepID=A0ACB9AG64_CICIN|nr:hypothetical protein L2E82_38569 [Cichorium intybus]
MSGRIRSRRRKVINARGTVSDRAENGSGFEKDQAWETISDLSGPSNTSSEDAIPSVRTSFAASSNNDPQQGDIPHLVGNGKSYASVVANLGTCRPSSPKTPSKQMIEEKSESDELDNLKYEHYNESHTKNLECPSEHTAVEDIDIRWNKADHLDNWEIPYKEKALQADERESKDIFTSRNDESLNQMTIDLHGQRVREGIKILENHLEFGVYCGSLMRLRVIIGYGSHRTGPSKLKSAVVDLLKKEDITFQEETKGSLLITFDGQKRELGFVECSKYSC